MDKSVIAQIVPQHDRFPDYHLSAESVHLHRSLRGSGERRQHVYSSNKPEKQ